MSRTLSRTRGTTWFSGRAGLPARQPYCVFNTTQESFLGMNVLRADTELARLRGLLGKLRLKSGDGLWVVPSRGIHTVGLLFPIDVVYLDEENRVVHCIEHLSPFRISPLRLKSASVLELPRHSIYASQTRVGHRILICRPQEMESYLRDLRVGWRAPGVAAKGSVPR